MPERPPETLPMIVNDVSHLFGDKMRSLEGGALPTSVRLILMVLSHGDGISQLEIAHCIHLKAPTVSSTLKKMEEENYIERAANLSDMRAMKVYLTEKGKKYNEETLAKLHSVDEILMRGIGEEEQEAAKAVLEKMRGNLLASLGLKPTRRGPFDHTEEFDDRD